MNAQNNNFLNFNDFIDYKKSQIEDLKKILKNNSEYKEDVVLRAIRNLELEIDFLRKIWKFFITEKIEKISFTELEILIENIINNCGNKRSAEKLKLLNIYLILLLSNNKTGSYGENSRYIQELILNILNTNKYENCMIFLCNSQKDFVWPSNFLYFYNLIEKHYTSKNSHVDINYIKRCMPHIFTLLFMEKDDLMELATIEFAASEEKFIKVYNPILVKNSNGSYSISVSKINKIGNKVIKLIYFWEKYSPLFSRYKNKEYNSFSKKDYSHIPDFNHYINIFLRNKLLKKLDKTHILQFKNEKRNISLDKGECADFMTAKLFIDQFFRSIYNNNSIDYDDYNLFLHANEFFCKRVDAFCRERKTELLKKKLNPPTEILNKKSSVAFHSDRDILEYYLKEEILNSSDSFSPKMGITASSLKTFFDADSINLIKSDFEKKSSLLLSRLKLVKDTYSAYSFYLDKFNKIASNINIFKGYIKSLSGDIDVHFIREAIDPEIIKEIFNIYNIIRKKTLKLENDANQYINEYLRVKGELETAKVKYEKSRTKKNYKQYKHQLKEEQRLYKTLFKKVGKMPDFLKYGTVVNNAGTIKYYCNYAKFDKNYKRLKELNEIVITNLLKNVYEKFNLNVSYSEVMNALNYCMNFQNLLHLPKNSKYKSLEYRVLEDDLRSENMIINHYIYTLKYYLKLVEMEVLGKNNNSKHFLNNSLILKLSNIHSDLEKTENKLKTALANLGFIYDDTVLQAPENPIIKFSNRCAIGNISYMNTNGDEVMLIDIPGTFISVVTLEDLISKFDYFLIENKTIKRAFEIALYGNLPEYLNDDTVTFLKGIFLHPGVNTFDIEKILNI